MGDGCQNCWAKRMACRLRGRYGYPADEPFRPTFHPERLSQVNPEQKPQVIALCFMSDPFHDEHSHYAIYNMLDKIILCPQHTFIALTKRARHMRDILFAIGKTIPNLIGGVSIWDQESADRMIPILLETNLATRIVSLEPMLGPVDLSLWLPTEYYELCGANWKEERAEEEHWDPPELHREFIDGVILGGESGPGARPMHPDWARKVRDQCQAAGVPFFFKQWGEWWPNVNKGISPDLRSKIGDRKLSDKEWGSINQRNEVHINGSPDDFNPSSYGIYRIGKKAAGRLLDGREWNEMPLREMP